MLPRITKISSIKDFQITCLWNTGETTTIDFEKLVDTEQGSLASKILTHDIFNTVKLDPVSKTLYWDNMMPFTDYDGQVKLGPLDFCPDVLYKISTVT